MPMQITYQRFTLTIEAIDELHLPYYKGSTFRGGFGNAFRRVVCALKRNDCSDCLLKSRCIYAYVFETFPQGGAEIMNMNKYEKVPHPFVIEPPEGIGDVKERIIQPGRKIDFGLILIGRATEYFPYFIYTFDELGRIGIGKGRGRYRLSIVNKLSKDGEAVCGEAGIVATPVYIESQRAIKRCESDRIDIPEDFKPDERIEEITLEFISPLRIKYNRDLVVTPEFHILIRNLLRRLGLLYYFHCGNHAPSWDHRAIIKHAETVKIQSSSLRWLDWERYSTRQQTRMRLGGLVGSITYRGNIEPFLPILRAGMILHIGKNTSFGLGRYGIVQKTF